MEKADLEQRLERAARLLNGIDPPSEETWRGVHVLSDATLLPVAGLVEGLYVRGFSCCPQPVLALGFDTAAAGPVSRATRGVEMARIPEAERLRVRTVTDEKVSAPLESAPAAQEA